MSKICIAAMAAVFMLGGCYAMADEFKRTEHPDAQWFGNAGLGLFFHWGIASVHGKLELSWAMLADVPFQKDPEGVVTAEEYFKLAERFNPDKYDPDKWLRAAKKMGCTYAVLTTKHHDGFALWPSKYGEFSTRNYLNGRDLVKPYVEACRKNGIKVGLYYSPPDWYYDRNYRPFNYVSGNNPEEPWFNMKHEAVEPVEKPEGWDDERRAYLKAQIEELLTQYGKIDLIWFDGGEAAITIESVRELQPGIVINNRMHGHGDFETPEWNLPTEPPKADWWENCTSWIHGWGYKSDEYYQTSAWMLTRLIQCRAWQGNLLLNLGPRPDGQLPDTAYERMKEVAAWMKHSHESVSGTSAGPWPSTANVPVTVNGDVWYLHALPEFEKAIVVTDTKKPSRVTLLRTGADLDFSFADGRLEVTIPKPLRTELPDVVKVQWQ